MFASLKGNRGFTVVEMMVGLVVVGITLAVSIPSFGRFMQSNGLKSSGEQVAGHMRLARQMAVADGVPRILVWNNSTYEYKIYRDNNGDGQPSGGEPYQGPYALSKQVCWKSQNANALSTGSVVFTPDGRASKSGTLTFENSRGNSVTLTLLGPTGQAQVTTDNPVGTETYGNKYSF